mgnify:CR=1 FL=1
MLSHNRGFQLYLKVQKMLGIVMIMVVVVVVVEVKRIDLIMKYHISNIKY